MANGFSGHGLQQSPAIGRALSELVAFGGYRTLDLRRFGYDRVLNGQAIREANVVYELKGDGHGEPTLR